MTSTFGQPRRDVVSYAQAHLRLKTWRGRPDTMSCIECGGTAAEWAYQGGDPSELTDAAGRTYSLDLDRYEPMCVPCHRRQDRARSDGRSPDVCPRGHLWSENASLRRKRSNGVGLRFCRACHREYSAEHRAAYGGNPEYRAKRAAAARARRRELRRSA